MLLSLLPLLFLCAAMALEFVYRSRMPASAEAVYQFHALPGALERLTPPWERVVILSRTGSIDLPGSRVEMKVRLGPFSRVWVAEHSACEPGRMFRDVMVSGPFPRWEHTHRFLPESASSSWLEDHIAFEMPLGRIGGWLAGGYTRRRLARLFAWRHRVTREALLESAAAVSS